MQSFEDSISLIDGAAVPEFIDKCILKRNKIEPPIDHNKYLNTETSIYLENCFKDGFKLFKEQIIDVCKNNYLIYGYNSIRYNLLLSGNFAINKNCYENAFYDTPYFSPEENNVDKVLLKLSNIRNLERLKAVSVFNDIYQFVFVLKSYIHRDLFKTDKQTDFYSFIFRLMPSYFFIQYHDEGGEYDESTLMFILSGMLTPDNRYEKHLLNYSKENSSINETDRNDLGQILYCSETPLEFIDSSFKRDLNFVKKLLSCDPYLLMYVDNALRNNKEVVMSAYKSYLNNPDLYINFSSGFFDQSAYGFFFEGIGDELKEDLMFINSIPKVNYDEDKFRKEMNQKGENKDGKNPHSDLPF